MLTLLLGGCWPYIDGTWAENAPARATGAVMWAEYEGSGWTSNDSAGAASWGWFQSPQIGFDTELVLPAGEGCSDNVLDSADFTDLLVELPGGESLFTSASVDVPLTWDEASKVYYAPLGEGDMDENAATWSLSETELQSGSLAVSPFIEVPGRIPYYGPDPGDEEDAQVPSISVDQLSITWSGDASDLVSVSAVLYTAGSVELERWTCAAYPGAGQVGVPTDRWDEDNVDQAVFVAWTVGHHVITSSPIAGMEAVARGVGTRTRSAIFRLEEGR